MDISLFIRSFFLCLLLEWWYMPDQVKYFTGAQKIREINFDIFGRMHEIGKFTIILPSIIYGLFPIPFIGN